MHRQLYRAVLAGCLFLLSVTAWAQQLPLTSQYMFNPLSINPAFAGTGEVPTVSMLARYQWVGLEKAPETLTFSAHAPVAGKRVGLGLTILQDKIGVHSNLVGATDYSYRIPTGPTSFVSMGLRVGLMNMRSDYLSIAGSSNDPKLGSSINETKLQLGSGIYFKSSKMAIGVSAPTLLNEQFTLNDSTDVQFAGLNLVGFMQYQFSLNQNWMLLPSVLVRRYPTLPVSVDVNFNFDFRNVLIAGLSYRSSQIAGLIKLQLTPQLQFGYAYDYPLKSATYTGSPSHELLLQYQFIRALRNIPSPRN